ncbi:MAG: hypothetical protein LBL21_01195 [Rickettsiales bacterium]|jgi:hypothetical protein|nr:hypothetical protein [Rickettsiales bacterium]
MRKALALVFTGLFANGSFAACIPGYSGGTKDHPLFKAINDSESCGAGWGEVRRFDIAPENELEQTDAKGTFSIAGCAYQPEATSCPAGKYMSNGVCANCGIGHYCDGGGRAPCTYGAAACPGENHPSDPPAPAGLPVNAILTMAQVSQYIPATNISRWKKIFCCSAQGPGGVRAFDTDPGSMNDIRAACADGIVGPGTYMSVNRYTDPCCIPAGSVDSLTGQLGVSDAHLMIFDKPVGYRGVHGFNVFTLFMDIAHAPFQSYTLAVPIMPTNITIGWTTNKNDTNVSGIMDVAEDTMICLFELK